MFTSRNVILANIRWMCSVVAWKEHYSWIVNSIGVIHLWISSSPAFYKLMRKCCVETWDYTIDGCWLISGIICTSVSISKNWSSLHLAVQVVKLIPIFCLYLGNKFMFVYNQLKMNIFLVFFVNLKSLETVSIFNLFYDTKFLDSSFMNNLRHIYF